MLPFILAMYVAIANGVYVPNIVQIIAWVVMVISVLAKVCAK